MSKQDKNLRAPESLERRHSMIVWKPEYMALLSRLIRERIFKVATPEGYYQANGDIGRAAHVHPPKGETIETVVERWITGESSPTPAQGERLVEWVPTIRDGEGRDVGIAESLAELIKEDKSPQTGREKGRRSGDKV